MRRVSWPMVAAIVIAVVAVSAIVMHRIYVNSRPPSATGGESASTSVDREPERDVPPDELPPPPKAVGPRLVVGPIPTAAPFEGEEGTDAYGYPRKTADTRALLSLLRLRRYGDLEKWMRFYQEAFEADYRKERWILAALGAFEVADPKMGRLLDEWIEAYPKSFAARAARGAFRDATAWYFRGGAYAHKTAQERFDKMHQWQRKARADLLAALELEPKLVAAYDMLLRISRATSGTAEESRKLFDAAIRVCPLCYDVRESYLGTLDPRWGGSFLQLTREVTAYHHDIAPKNPRLSLLRSKPLGVRCLILMNNDKLKQADAMCSEAEKLGERAGLYSVIASLRYQQKRYAEAIAAATKTIALSPSALSARKTRAWSALALENYLQAGRDALYLRQRDSTTRSYARLADRVFKHLRFEGHQSYKNGDYEQAGKLLLAALMLSPDNHDIMRRLAYNDTKLGVDKLRAAIGLAPDAFELHLRLDYALASQRRWPEIIAMWDAYLRRNPTDPRAWKERAGAKWQHGKRQEALEDSDRACKLSLPTACSDSTGMRARLKRARQ